MSHQAEQELFLRARAGDRLAFDRLQTMLEAPIHRFVFRLIGRSESEADIVRNVLLALYMNLERIHSVESLRPFIFRIARNLCYNEMRRKGRFQTVSLDVESGEIGTLLAAVKDRRPSPEDRAQWTLLYAEIQRAIDRLPELQRQALILYCEEDLSYAQIAEVMAADVGTVKSRIYYARKNLERLLHPETLEALNLNNENNHG